MNKNITFAQEKEGNVEFDWAEAFPINSIVPEDLLRDIVSRKRMRKLQEMDIKPKATLEGIFPEIVFEKRIKEETIT